MVIISYDFGIYCSPATSSFNTTLQFKFKTNKESSWPISFVEEKLQYHVRKLEVDLEVYLELRYLPHLRTISNEVDSQTPDIDGKISSYSKAFLRVATIHAYLTTHQAALASAAVSLLLSYLHKLEKTKQIKEIKDSQLRLALMFLNYQIRSYTYEHKFDYLLEYAHLCSKYEAFYSRFKKSEFETFIDFVKMKTSLSLSKMARTKEQFYAAVAKIKWDDDELKQAIDFKINDDKLLGYADQFYIRLGLEPIISGYLYMSHDNDFHAKDRINRKFLFKKYFESSKKTDGEAKFKSIVSSLSAYDPDLPIDITSIGDVSLEKKGSVKVAYDFAASFLKDGFYDELIESILPEEEEKAFALGSMVTAFAELGNILAEYDEGEPNNGKNKRDGLNILTRGLLLDKMSLLVVEHQFLKSNVCRRFVDLAKSFLGYYDEEYGDNRKVKFTVPFNNHIFALRVQVLLFSYYPLMQSQASDSIRELAKFNLDVDEFEKKSDEEFKDDEISRQTQSLYSALRVYRKREDIVTKVRLHKFESELQEFRSLEKESQDYYVAFSNIVFENVLSMYLEPPFNQMDNYFDYLRKLIIDYLIADRNLGSIAMRNGRSIESNIIYWNIVGPVEEEEPKL